MMDADLRNELDRSICSELDRMIVRIKEGEWLDSEEGDRIARAMSASRERLNQLTT